MTTPAALIPLTLGQARLRIAELTAEFDRARREGDLARAQQLAERIEAIAADCERLRRFCGG